MRPCFRQLQDGAIEIPDCLSKANRDSVIKEALARSRGWNMADVDFELIKLGLQEWDIVDDNIDVIVELADGRRFTATFFTLKNIESLFRKNRETGECSSGTYFWAVDMILVEDLKRSTLEATVKGLLQDHELESALACIPDEKEDDA